MRCSAATLACNVTREHRNLYKIMSAPVKQEVTDMAVNNSRSIQLIDSDNKLRTLATQRRQSSELRPAEHSPR